MKKSDAGDKTINRKKVEVTMTASKKEVLCQEFTFLPKYLKNVKKIYVSIANHSLLEEKREEELQTSLVTDIKLLKQIFLLNKAGEEICEVGIDPTKKIPKEWYNPFSWGNQLYRQKNHKNIEETLEMFGEKATEVYYALIKNYESGFGDDIEKTLTIYKTSPKDINFITCIKQNWEKEIEAERQKIKTEIENL